MLKKMSTFRRTVLALLLFIFVYVSFTSAATRKKVLNPKDPKHREEASKKGRIVHVNSVLCVLSHCFPFNNSFGHNCI